MIFDNTNISNSLINLVSEENHNDDEGVTLQELEDTTNLFDESVVSFDNVLEGIDLRSPEDINHKLKNLNEILALMKITSSKSASLANQLDDADVYNATSSVLKRTFDSHVNYIKIVDNLNNSTTELEAIGEDGSSSYITLDDLNELVLIEGGNDEEEDEEDEEEG